VTAFYSDVAKSSATDEWWTPPEIVDPLAAEFGPFDLDPAATAENAKAPLFYTREDDGLTQPWAADRVWLNPPYGRIVGTWIGKAVAEVGSGNAGLVVCLVPARTGTAWWRAATSAASLVRFWPHRITFGGVGGPAPFDSAIIVFGTLPGRHGTLPAWCTVCNELFWPYRADARTCSPACRKALSRRGWHRNAR